MRANIGASRWRPLGRHCVVTHTGHLTEQGRCWAAVLEAGPRAFIDGESSLVLAGLENYAVGKIRVSVPRGARIRHRNSGVDIRQTRRWRVDDLAVEHRVPRSRNAVAAVRAALWARSDRQAALLLVMAVQQNLTSAAELAEELLTVRRDRRRLLVSETVADLAGGVGSLSELDLLRGCRERGLPEADSQVLRKTANGSYYLDFRWRRWCVVVEVDGIQHTWVAHLIGDALRHNTIAIDGDTVLRLPVIGLRLCPDEFFAQIEEALAARGWSRSMGVSA